MKSDRVANRHRGQEPSLLELETVAQKENGLLSELGQAIHQGDLKNQHGSALLAVLVAVAIIAGGAVALLQGLSTGSIAASTVDEKVTAGNIARRQLESTRSEAYLFPPASYPTVSAPPGWSVSADALILPDADAGNNIEQIQVIVSRNGNQVLEIWDYKLNR